MPRFQTDDTFGDSLPAKKAGTAALGLYYLCGLWSARYLTDGHVPTEVAAGYGTAEWVRRLVDAGLFLVEDGGYLMPLYLNDNPSAEKVLAERKAKAERQAKWLEKHRNPRSKQRRVSSPSNRPSNETSRDASEDAAPPLPSPKGEGVGAAPRSGGAAAPTRTPTRTLTSGRVVCATHQLEVPCRGCASDLIVAADDDDLDQRPPVPERNDRPKQAEGSDVPRNYAAARAVLDVLPDREDWLAAARKHLAKGGEPTPTMYRITTTAAELYQASQQPDPPPAPEEE